MFIATSDTPKGLIQPRTRSTQIPTYQFSATGALTIQTPRKDLSQPKKKSIIALSVTSRTPAHKSPISPEKVNTNSSRVYKESLFSEYAFNPRKMSQDSQQPDNSGKKQFFPLANPNINDLNGLKYVMSNSSDLVSGQVPQDIKIKFQPFLIPYKRPQPKEIAPLANTDPIQETPKQIKKKVQILKRLDGYEPLGNQLPLNKKPITTNNKADFRISHYLRVKSYTTEHSPQPSNSSRNPSPFGKGSIASTRITTERNGGNGTTRRSNPQEIESIAEVKTTRQPTDVSCIRMLDLCNTDILDEMQKKSKNTDSSVLDSSESARVRTQFDVQKLKEKIRFTPIFDCRLVSIVNKNHLSIVHKPSPKLESNLLNRKFMSPQIKGEHSYMNELSQAYSLPPMQTPIKQNERMQLSKLVRFEVKG